MEEGNRHIDIDELFRRRLGNAGVEPSQAFSNIVMKKTARMEFLRFNPSRFNAWYAGILAVAVITAGIIILSGKGESPEKQIIVPENENTETVAPPKNSDVVKPSGRQGRAEGRQVENQALPVAVVAALETRKEETEPVDRQEDPVMAAGISGSHRKTGFFESPAVSNSLKEMQTSAGKSLFVPSVAAGCAPLQVSFSNNAESYSDFRWDFGDGGHSDAREPQWVFSSPGEYTVNMSASAEGRSPVSHSVHVKVYPAPKADFEISPATVVIPDEEVQFLNYSRDAVASRWDFGDGNSSGTFEPNHRYGKFGTYDVKLVVTSENGCSDSVIVADAFSGSAYFIEMPNAFIPNPLGPSGGFYSPRSDESAEIFHPSFSGVSMYRMQIFSKIGVLLFETKDINVGWDGYYKGELSNPGVYIWQISGRFSNGQTFSKKGDVTLLRSQF